MKTQLEINAANLAAVQLKDLEFMQAKTTMNFWLLSQLAQEQKEVDNVNKKGLEYFHQDRIIDFIFCGCFMLCSSILASIFIASVFREQYVDAAFMSVFVAGALFCTYTFTKFILTAKFTPIEPSFNLV